MTNIDLLSVKGCVALPTKIVVRQKTGMRIGNLKQEAILPRPCSNWTPSTQFGLNSQGTAVCLLGPEPSRPLQYKSRAIRFHRYPTCDES